MFVYLWLPAPGGSAGAVRCRVADVRGDRGGSDLNLTGREWSAEEDFVQKKFKPGSELFDRIEFRRIRRQEHKPESSIMGNRKQLFLKKRKNFVVLLRYMMYT